jgi:hypothetical protein
VADVHPARERRRFDVLALLIALAGVLVALCAAIPPKP